MESLRGLLVSKEPIGVSKKPIGVPSERPLDASVRLLGTFIRALELLKGHKEHLKP